MTSSDDPLTEPAVPRLGLSLVTILAIAFGGALGTLARFLLDTRFVDGPGHFPTVTLLINLSGSLAIGICIPFVERWTQRQPLLRPFVVVGILGGWTTYSALAVSAITLLQSGHVASSVLYLAATLAGGTGLVVLGAALSRRLTTT
jgi:fluoride exporter